jgi:hypothetical protein
LREKIGLRRRMAAILTMILALLTIVKMIKTQTGTETEKGKGTLKIVIHLENLRRLMSKRLCGRS